jgi:3-phenylpropionate/cinnamic acid dioxygenase small subunit
MGSSDLRKKLHTYIADLDEKKVKAMLTLLEDEAPYEIKSSLTDKEKEEIRKREQNRVSGKSKTYPLAEAKKLFRRKNQ